MVTQTLTASAAPAAPPASRALRVTALFAFGAVAGSLLDALHTHSGTTRYAHALFFRMAWWTPLVFGGAGLATGLAFPLGAHITGSQPCRRLSLAELLASFGFFSLLYACSGYLPLSNALKLVLLLCGALALWLAQGRSRLGLALALLTATVGPALEAALAATGGFSHSHPDFAGIPLWLPGLYACGGLAFGAVGHHLLAPPAR